MCEGCWEVHNQIPFSCFRCLRLFFQAFAFDVMPPRRRALLEEEGRPELRETPSHHLVKALSSFGWAFDCFIVLLNLADAVTDFAVTTQLYHEGNPSFWVPLIVLIISSIVLAVSGMLFLQRSMFNYANILPSSFSELSLPATLLCLLPIAQLLPVAHWVCQTFFVKDVPLCEKHIHRAALLPVYFRTAQSQVAHEELALAERSAVVAGSLISRNTRDVRTHAMLLVEAITQALPMLFVQVAICHAASSQFSPSTLQIVSIVLSFLNVVSKAYFLCGACDLRVMLFKFVAIQFDLFTYCCLAALVGRGIRDSNSFVGWLTFYWMSWSVCLSLLIVGTMFFGMLRVFRELFLNGKVAICCALATCLLPVVPTFALLQAAKLSIISFWLRNDENLWGPTAHTSLLFSFMMRDSGHWPWGPFGSWDCKMRRLFLEAYQLHKASTQPSDARRKWLSVTDLITSQLQSQSTQSAEQDSEATSLRLWCTPKDGCDSLSLPEIYDAEKAVTAGDEPTRKREKALLISLVLHSLFPLFLPVLCLVSLSFRGKLSQEPFLLYCLSTAAVCLAFTILYSPIFVRYVKFVLQAQYVDEAPCTVVFDTDPLFVFKALRWAGNAISQYYMPTAQSALCSWVPSNLLPLRRRQRRRLIHGKG